MGTPADAASVRTARTTSRPVWIIGTGVPLLRMGIEAAAVAIGSIALLGLGAIHQCGSAAAEEATPSPFTDTSRSPAPRPAWTPGVCTSLDPVTKRVGRFGVVQPSMIDSCPRGSAFVAQATMNSQEMRVFQNTPLQGNCCPLPPDALTSAIHLFAGHCPAGSVVTGVRGYSSETMDLSRHQPSSYLFECTFINSNRYQLGPEGLAVRIATAPHGFNRHGARSLLGLEPNVTVSWNRIPPGLRYAVGRVSRNGHEQHHCTGYPWGSLLVGRGERTDCGYMHRELQYAGIGGDPPRGSPVPIFADCDAVESPLGEAPRCVKMEAE